MRRLRLSVDALELAADGRGGASGWMRWWRLRVDLTAATYGWMQRRRHARGRVMHEKCITDLGGLLSHILSYLIVL
jgi:hypothetical protein